MIPNNVTLIVKAPNQQIDDQNVECQSSWTVGQLKGHLSQVYPSKPRTEEQKIIYSGQLLDDNIILKDVLRTYESQIGHTMHLVCTPNKRILEPIRTMPNPPPTPVAPTTPDGIRRRNIENTPENTPRPETRQNDQNHTVEMQNYISSYVNNYGRVPPYHNMREGYLPVPNEPMLVSNNIMMMQQAYWRYMQQYNNMWQATQQPGEAPPAAAAPPAPAPAPEAGGPAAGAGAGPGEEGEEGGARDWLDVVYAASRLCVFASLVYLYGSGARLALVLLLLLAGYLHQIGFFRELNLNPQRNNNEQQRADQNGRNQNGANENGANQMQDNQVNDNQQSLLAVTWMIFTSFFASLIPEANH